MALRRPRLRGNFSGFVCAAELSTFNASPYRENLRRFQNVVFKAGAGRCPGRQR
jgi:hypothetical protein